MLNLNSDIKYIRGVGEKRAELFNKLGIFDVRSLLCYYPRRYQDWSKERTVAQCVSGENVCIKATLIMQKRSCSIRNMYFSAILKKN